MQVFAVPTNEPPTKTKPATKKTLKEKYPKIQEQLINDYGLYVQHHFIQSCINKTSSSNSSINKNSHTHNTDTEHVITTSQVFELAINETLTSIGVPFLNKKNLNQNQNNRKLSGKYLFQIFSFRDIAKPMGKQNLLEVKSDNLRMLHFMLTDGKNKIDACEYRHCSVFDDVSIFPGTKMQLENIQILNGVILLRPANVNWIGGEIESFKKKFSDRLSSMEKHWFVFNKNISKDETPPPMFSNTGKKRFQSEHRHKQEIRNNYKYKDNQNQNQNHDELELKLNPEKHEGVECEAKIQGQLQVKGEQEFAAKNNEYGDYNHNEGYNTHHKYNYKQQQRQQQQQQPPSESLDDQNRQCQDVRFNNTHRNANANRDRHRNRNYNNTPQQNRGPNYNYNSNHKLNHNHNQNQHWNQNMMNQNHDYNHNYNQNQNWNQTRHPQGQGQGQYIHKDFNRVSYGYGNRNSLSNVMEQQHQQQQQYPLHQQQQQTFLTQIPMSMHMPMPTQKTNRNNVLIGQPLQVNSMTVVTLSQLYQMTLPVRCMVNVIIKTASFLVNNGLSLLRFELTDSTGNCQGITSPAMMDLILEQYGQDIGPSQQMLMNFLQAWSFKIIQMDVELHNQQQMVVCHKIQNVY